MDLRCAPIKMGHGTWASVLAGGLVLVSACAPPPTLQLFGTASAPYEALGPVQDTLLIYRQTPEDSVSVQGVDMTLDVLAFADSTGRRELAATLREALQAIPAEVRARTFPPGAHNRAVARRLGGSAFVDRLEMMRADLVVIDTAFVDTVTEPWLAEGETREVTWLALVVRGTAFLNPELGRDPDANR